mgnify:CR=1 FL=1
MPSEQDPRALLFDWWERFLNAKSEAFGGDRELTVLSDKLDEVRRAAFADREVTHLEWDTILRKMEAVTQIYAQWAARKGVPGDAPLACTSERFRVFREAAEIHFQTLAGSSDEHFRGGLLRHLLHAVDAEPVIGHIALDLLASASAAIAVDKVHLLRAQLSLLGSGARQRDLLQRLRAQLAKQLTRPVWTAHDRTAAIDLDTFDRESRYESVVAMRRLALPEEIRGTNRMLPNRPVAGRDAAHRRAVKGLLDDLSAAGKLFVDHVETAAPVVRVAVKIELNLGTEGPPSVTDPAVLYAVIRELLKRFAEKKIAVQITVGDSNGIENAPVGRTSLDVMRDTGNYHAALKAGLEFAAHAAMPEGSRKRAQASLDRLHALEQMQPPVYVGSLEDRLTTLEELGEAEAAASPWVVCVDYDVTGFRTVTPDLGPLGRAVHGSSRFHVAEPWAAADYRVHVSRSASNHLFAGWTGALKGLIGLHALGCRPGDVGMRERGQSPLDVLLAVMHSASFTGLLSARAGVMDFSRLLSDCEDMDCRAAGEKSLQSWSRLMEFAAGRAIWAEGALALDKELREAKATGIPDMDIMARMRRATAELVERAERASPGFRAALVQGVGDGTRAFLLTMWRMRDLIPLAMRDASMGQRIGLLSHLPYQADLVVQGMAKIGLGGGPDAYFEVRDVGVVVAGTDEMAVDLAALRAAGVPGNPWEYNYPIGAALQFGRGPMCWEEIRDVSSGELKRAFSAAGSSGGDGW